MAHEKDTTPETGRRPRFWQRAYWQSFRTEAARDRSPAVWYIRRYDAQVYAIIVAIVVPLEAWLIQDFTVKVVLAAIWLAFTHEYWAIELDEIRAQLKEHGLLNVEESDYQRSTMQSLYWGVGFAGVLWLVVLIGHLVANWSGDWWARSSLLWNAVRATPLYYGIVELAILVHTLYVGRRVIKRVYPMISQYQQALAFQMRRETKAAD